MIDFYNMRILILTALMPLCLMQLAGCSSGGSDPGDGFTSTAPVSSADNPPIESLNDVLAAPDSERTAFHPLRSFASGRFLSTFSSYPDSYPSSTYVQHSVSDGTTPSELVVIDGGFTGVSDNHIGYFSTSTSTVSDSADGLYRTFGGVLTVLVPGPGASELDYTSFGVGWTSHLDWGCNYTSCVGSGDMFYDATAFSFGLMTPAENIPQTGGAIFNGYMAGTYIAGSYPDPLTGNANLQVDFGGRSVTGSLSNIVGGNFNTSYPSIALSGSFSGNQISGSATSAYMSGDFVARFYGPNAEEIGGTFAMSGDVTNTAVSGAFAAKQ